MRIALVTEVFLPAVDGVVTRLRRTLEELHRFDDEVLLVAPAGGPHSYGGARVVGVPGLRVPLTSFADSLLSEANRSAGRRDRSWSNSCAAAKALRCFASPRPPCTLPRQLTPSNVGVFQAACIAVLHPFGVDASQALAYGLVLQAVEIVDALVLGGLALVREGLRWGDLRHREDDRLVQSGISVGPGTLRERTID